MYQKCLLLEPTIPLNQILSEGALLQVITQSPLPEVDEIPISESNTMNSESDKDSSSTTKELDLPSKPQSSLLPIFTNPKRILNPSLEELKELSETELSRVEHVSITEPGIGRVEWEEPVDLRGLNLDDLVTFDTEDGYPSVTVSLWKWNDL